MKHLHLSLLTIVVALGLSCQKDSSPTRAVDQPPGYVSFQLFKHAIPSVVATIAVTLEKSGSASIHDSVSVSSAPGDTVSLFIDDIPTGTWNLTVRAMDESGTVRYIGTATVLILSNQTTTVSVMMEAVDTGTGTLRIHIFWGDPECTPSPDNMLAWWRAEGTAEDSISGLSGSFYGEAGYDTGVVNQAFTFNGTSFLEIPDTSSIDLTSSFSIVLWFRLEVPLANQPDYLGSGWNDFPVLVEKGTGGYATRNYGIYFDKWNNELHFNATDTSQSNSVFAVIVADVNTLVDDLEWHCLAAVWDENELRASIFLDGVLRGVSLGYDRPMRPNNETLKFAGAAPGQYLFRGSMDEIVFFDGSLDVQSVQKIYLAKSNGICP